MSTLQKMKNRAISMIRGKGNKAVTQYSCGIVDQAKEEGVKIRIVKRNKEGEKVSGVTDGRTVHRDLLAIFSETHERAGQGKYIDLEAFPNGDTSQIVGAQHVNPYLRDEGSYSTIIETLKRTIDHKVLSRLKSQLVTGRHSGHNLIWEGCRNKNGSVVCSDFYTKEVIWNMACKFNASLYKNLRKSKSGKKNATHNSAREKFFINLDVLRRATCVVHIVDGTRELRGGATPCAKPLEQCGFAIDWQYLTYGIDSNGNELGQYYYRLAIGRSEPHILNRASWKYEDSTSSIAFKNKEIKKMVANFL